MASSDSGAVILFHVRRLAVGLKDRIKLSFESLFDPQGERICVQCRCVSDEDFCSKWCELRYWAEFRRQYSICSGKPPVCNLPGCVDQCYVENNGHIHDYCKRNHAEQHKKMVEAAERFPRGKKKKGGRGKGGRGGRGGGGGGGGGEHQWGNGQKVGRGGGNGGQHQGAHGPGHSPSGGYQFPWSLTGPIYFYNRDEPYYEFTNFYKGYSIRLDNETWPTTEHYFQAQKFVGTPYVEKIRNAPGPRDAFELSRNPQISRWRRSDWEDVKMDIMRKALFAKFTQHKFLKDRLLGTGDRELFERSPYDSFWGDGGDGTGQNHLGKLLMELRKKLRGDHTDVQRDGITRRHSLDQSALECVCSGPAVSGSSGEVKSSVPSSDELARLPLHRSMSSGGRMESANISPQKEEVPTAELVDIGSEDLEKQQKQIVQDVNEFSFMGSNEQKNEPEDMDVSTTDSQESLSMHMDTTQ